MHRLFKCICIYLSLFFCLPNGLTKPNVSGTDWWLKPLRLRPHGNFLSPTTFHRKPESFFLKKQKNPSSSISFLSAIFTVWHISHCFLVRKITKQASRMAGRYQVCTVWVQSSFTSSNTVPFLSPRPHYWHQCWHWLTGEVEDGRMCLSLPANENTHSGLVSSVFTSW